MVIIQIQQEEEKKLAVNYSKRRCKKIGCLTPLNSYHLGSFCHAHEVQETIKITDELYKIKNESIDLRRLLRCKKEVDRPLFKNTLKRLAVRRDKLNKLI